jgi:O-antigen ligase
VPPPTETVSGAATPPGGWAKVVELGGRVNQSGPSTSRTAFGWIAVVVAAVLALSPLAIGYFDFGLWGLLALGAMVLLIIVAWAARPELNRRLLVAGGAILLLLALSAASMLWAQSKDSAWTDTNRLALYVVIFAIVVLSVRERRTARLIVLLLGAGALITSIWFPVSFLFGLNQGAFLTRRLNSPIGYINGTAGLLVMGIWPWLAYAETAARRELRAAAFGAATLIAGTFILTESRAVIPATVLSAVLVLACAPGRTRRAVNLLLLGICVAASLHWSLAVYTDGGAAATNNLPGTGVVRGAGVAILLAAALGTAAFFGLSIAVDRIAPARRAMLSRRLGLSMLVAVVVIVGGGVIAGRHDISRQWHNFTSLHAPAAASVRFVDASGFRYDLWRVAVKEFRDHPLGGLGAGNYDTDYYRLRKNPEYVVQPHSLELQMAAELGIGGLIALLVFCGAVLSAGFVRAGTLASEDLLIRIAALGVFAAWLIDTSVDWLYDIPGLAGMAFVAAALLVAPAVNRRSAEPGPATAPAAGPPSRRRSGQAVRIVGLVVLALAAASVGRQYVANRYTASGAGNIAQNPRGAIGTLRKAARLNPYSMSTLYDISSAYAKLDDYQQARDALLVAQQTEPSNYVPPALLGDLAMRRGDYAVAVASYRRASQLDPNDSGVETSLQTAEQAAKG